MRVDFYATLRVVTGQKTVDFDIPDDPTVRQLIDAIVNRFPLMRDKLLQKDGNLWGHVHIFINGRDAPFLTDQLDTVIKSDDVISVFPAVGGG